MSRCDFPAAAQQARVRQQAIAAWNAYLQEGWLQQGHLESIRNDRERLIELVYGAFCTAWVAGRDDLVPSVNAIAVRATKAEREACARFAEQQAIEQDAQHGGLSFAARVLREFADALRQDGQP